MAGMNLVSHGTQDMYPTFLQRDWGFSPQKRAALTAFSMVGAIIGGVSFGYLSDRIGRRRSIVLALVLAIAMIPLWAFSPSIIGLVIGAFAMQFMVQGAWGVIPAHITELSPDSVRGFLPGFAYQCGVLLASSVGYLEGFVRGENELRALDGDRGAHRFLSGRDHRLGRARTTRRRVWRLIGGFDPRSWPASCNYADSISFALAVSPSSSAWTCSALVRGFIIVTRRTGLPSRTVAVIQPLPSLL